MFKISSKVKFVVFVWFIRVLNTVFALREANFILENIIELLQSKIEL